MKLLKPLATTVAFAASFFPTNAALGEPLADSLQGIVLEYGVTIGEDTRVTRENTEKIISEMARWQISTCEMQAEIWAKSPRGQQQIRNVLNDLLDRQRREYQESLDILSNKFDKQESRTNEHEKELSRLAFQLAVQSSSMSEIKNEIIPTLFEQLSGKLDRVDDLDIKLTLLSGQLSRMDSLCERMRANEMNDARVRDQVAANAADIDRLKSGRYAMRRPSTSAGETLREAAVMIDDPFQNQFVPFADGSGRGRWIRPTSPPMRVNNTQWEPDRYDFSPRVCPDPTPGPAYAYFEVGITLNGRPVRIREFGYMLRNCKEEAVMIRTHTQYLD